MTTLQFDIYDKDFLCDTDEVKALRREPNEDHFCYVYDGVPLPGATSNIMMPPVGLRPDSDDELMCAVLISLWGQAGYPPARFEFLYTKDEHGVLVFDAEGNLLFHAVSATLGYSGSGSILSRTIMKASGFSDEDFETVNARVKRREEFTYRLGVLIKPS